MTNIKSMYSFFYTQVIKTTKITLYLKKCTFWASLTAYEQKKKKNTTTRFSMKNCIWWIHFFSFKKQS